MFNPRQVLYLGGKEPDPDGSPFRSDVQTSRVIGMGGIRVNEGNGTTMVSLDDELFRRVSESIPAPPASDPFSDLAFRAFWVSDPPDNSVRVNAGYVSYTYWDVSSWLHAQLEIAEETVPLPGSSFPYYLYLKIPVVTTVGATSADGPYQTFNSSSTIEGNPYDFETQAGTTWVGPDPTPPVSYYTILTSPPAASSSFFQLLLAEIPAAGSVNPKTFGDIKLPQPMYTNLTSLTVTP